MLPAPHERDVGRLRRWRLPDLLGARGLYGLAGLAKTVEVAGVSAGAAMGLAAALGLEEALVAAFCARTAVNPRNVYPERVFLGRPVFPQEAMYRATMRELLGDASLQRLAQAPRVRILQACVKPGWLVAPTVASAWWAYAARRRRGLLHGPEVPHRGVAAEVDTAQEATSVDDLAERVLRSSASPPVTPILRARVACTSTAAWSTRRPCEPSAPRRGPARCWCC
ncbi:patatin-like phospholipase family protein [Nannocystis pusilla]|uniref:patatin-like phospholipase family protein n=1 Tax=Nannocystis pusilla TaxID=889268 RepID=UPI003B7E3D4A